MWRCGLFPLIKSYVPTKVCYVSVLKSVVRIVDRAPGSSIEHIRRLTHLSSMPWVRLSFMLTITSRGCIFLSPLHFGVVTLPRECTSDTNDYYVRPHMYTLPDDDVVTQWWWDQRLSSSLFLSFRLSTHAVQFAATWEFCSEHRRAYIRTSSGLSQSPSVAVFVAHCCTVTVSVSFLPCRFSDLNLSIPRERAHQRDYHDAIKSETRNLRTFETNLRKFRTQQSAKYHTSWRESINLMSL